MPERARSRAFLLALLRPRFESSLAPSERPDELDWDWILERAVAHKVAPLLASRLTELGVVERLAPELRSRLGEIGARAADHVSTARRTLGFLEDKLGGAGIPYFVIKGSVLAELVYPRPAMRTFSDIDVVVPPERFAAAVGVLESAGCRVAQVRQTLGARPRPSELEAARRLTRDFYERFDHELPLLAPPESGTLPIDLHWHIAPRSRLSVAPARVWERTRRVRIGELEVTTLDLEATLLHLAVHATTCALAGFRLLHLCDVAWVAAAGIDQKFWELAASWNATRHVKAVLAMARHLFAAEAGPPSAPREAEVLPSRYALVARDAFLVDALPGGAARRIGAEILWGAAMGCLGRTTRRALGVRLTRARWRWIQWRADTPPPG